MGSHIRIEPEMLASICFVNGLVRSVEPADDTLSGESDHSICTRVGKEPLSFVTT